MKNKFFKIAPAIVLLIITVSCNDVFGPRIKGSGNVISEERFLGKFDEIQFDGSYDIELIKGSKHKIVIESDDNIIPVVLSRVSDGELKVYSRHNLRPSERIKVWVTIEDIESLTIHGSADLSSEDVFTGEYFTLNLSGSGSAGLTINYSEFDAHISGSGRFYLDGQVDEQNISISGSGDYYGASLRSNKTYSSVSGSGNIYIHAEQYLNARISGSGNIYYYGSPQIKSSISGSGNIVKKR